MKTYKLYLEDRVETFNTPEEAIEAGKYEIPPAGYEGPSGWRGPWVEEVEDPDEEGEVIWSA